MADVSQSETSSQPTELELLCAATRRAISFKLDADAAVKRRNNALKDLRDLLGGGDLLAVIYNAQKRIGEMMTEDQ